MAKPTTQEQINDVSFRDALSERYLAYALSTITARSLPDVRDGLKPVHRRLMYAMLQLKLDPDSGFKKCARIVGEVMGKYHPHGDASIYDAMVRLAQTFAVRYPLVDGQGNFGSIDGDNAAAMRYTESRLTDFAMAQLENIDMDTVDFRATYDGSEEEPIVLPASVPNLLANGSEGIAVGMATSIPPHNVDEICEALLQLLRKPSSTVQELLELIPGPDFPTGGIISESKITIREAYETGRGAIRLRARWRQQELSHGLYQIVVTEIPYQVSKSKLIEKIAELFKAKKLPLLGNIRDESAEDIRVILEPKSRTIDPELLMESLFKVTDLQVRFNLNLNVLSGGGMPKVMNLKEILECFITHRFEVLERRTKFRLGKIEARLEILGGLLIAYLNLDEVIRIIRREDEPKPVLMKRFKITDNQAEAILNTRLRSLRKLEEMAIKSEKKELEEEQKELQSILKDKTKARGVIRDEIKDIQTRFGKETPLGKRRTAFGKVKALPEVGIEAFVEKEPITVVYSKMGWIKSLKGHLEDLGDVKFKEGDEVAFAIRGKSTDSYLFFSTSGRFFTLTGDKIPGGKGYGEPLRLFVGLGNEDDVVSALVYEPGQKLLLAADTGKGFIVPSDEVVASTRGGKQVLNPGKGKALRCRVVDGELVACIGTNRKLLVFPVDQVPPMTKGQGITLQKYSDKNTRMSDVKVFKRSDGLCWNLGGKIRCETDIRSWLGDRAHAGKLPPNGFPRSNRFD